MRDLKQGQKLRLKTKEQLKPHISQEEGNKITLSCGNTIRDEEIGYLGEVITFSEWWDEHYIRIEECATSQDTGAIFLIARAAIHNIHHGKFKLRR